MPWFNSQTLSPPLSEHERMTLAEGVIVLRQAANGVIVVCPQSLIDERGKRITGCGVTYGPNNEDAFLHIGARLGERQEDS